MKVKSQIWQAEHLKHDKKFKISGSQSCFSKVFCDAFFSWATRYFFGMDLIKTGIQIIFLPILLSEKLNKWVRLSSFCITITIWVPFMIVGMIITLLGIFIEIITE